MIQQSLQYLRNDEEQWVKTVLIGGILSLLGVLIVPTFLVLGYLVRVVRGTMHDDEQPPAFDEWGDLFVDGLKAFVVTFVYGLVPGLIVTVVIGGSIFSFVAGGGSESASLVGLGMVGLLVGGLLAFVLGLLAAYVIPAAVAAFAETIGLGAAFSIGELRPVLTSGTYATAWGYGLAIIVVAGLVAGALNAIPVLGSIAGAFIGFYAAVAAYYLIGHAWGELRGVELNEPDDAMGESPAV
jgi:hypothetical protein